MKTKRTKSKQAKSVVKLIEEFAAKPQMAFLKQLPPVNKKYLMIGLVVIILAALTFYFRNLFVVAVVNGKPITRLSLIKELEKQSGKKTLDLLVTQELLYQEAQKQQVTVTTDEVNQEIKKLEDNFVKQGQNLNQLLLAQGMTRDSLADQIKLQKLAEKLVEKDVVVSDQEVDDYLKQNAASLPKETKPEDLKTQVKDELKQQKLSEQIQALLQKLHDSAKINYL
jgi:foldase protein PrsA